jgi:ribonuclease HII
MRDSKRIDEINILEATKEAMADAVAAAQEMLAAKCGGTIGHVLFDAVKVDAVKLPQTSLIKGDARSVSIAAASILAKVTRDRMMVEYAKEYPDYAFEKNKGYGTAAHYEGIKKAGMTPIHRRSFLKNLSEH